MSRKNHSTPYQRGNQETGGWSQVNEIQGGLPSKRHPCNNADPDPSCPRPLGGHHGRLSQRHAALRRLVRDARGGAQPSASTLAGYLEALRVSGTSAAKVNMTLYGGKAALEQTAVSLGMSGRELAL